MRSPILTALVALLISLPAAADDPVLPGAVPQAASSAAPGATPAPVTPALPAAGPLVERLEDAATAILAGAVPSDVLPTEVEEVPRKRLKELRDLLAASGAVRVGLEAIELTLAFPGEQPTGLAVTVHPGPTPVLLHLRRELTEDQGAASLSVDVWREPFVELATAGRTLANLLAGPRCSELPFIDDAALAEIVPARFLDEARARRTGSRDALPLACADAAAASQGNVHVGFHRFHFNLYAEDGTIVGGLETGLQRAVAPYRLDFPRFKALPPP